MIAVGNAGMRDGKVVSAEIVVEDAYEIKDELKVRGYRWTPAVPGLVGSKGNWEIWLMASESKQEAAWLVSKGAKFLAGTKDDSPSDEYIATYNGVR